MKEEGQFSGKTSKTKPIKIIIDLEKIKCCSQNQKIFTHVSIMPALNINLAKFCKDGSDWNVPGNGV